MRHEAAPGRLAQGGAVEPDRDVVLVRGPAVRRSLEVDGQRGGAGRVHVRRVHGEGLLPEGRIAALQELPEPVVRVRIERQDRGREGVPLGAPDVGERVARGAGRRIGHLGDLHEHAGDAGLELVDPGVAIGAVQRLAVEEEPTPSLVRVPGHLLAAAGEEQHAARDLLLEARLRDAEQPGEGPGREVVEACLTHRDVESGLPRLRRLQRRRNARRERLPVPCPPCRRVRDPVEGPVERSSFRSLRSLPPLPRHRHGERPMDLPPSSGLDLFQQVDLPLARRGTLVEQAIGPALGSVDQAGEQAVVHPLIPPRPRVPARDVEARRARLRGRRPLDLHAPALAADRLEGGDDRLGQHLPLGDRQLAERAEQV